MEASGHSGVPISMELVRVKQEAERDSAGEAREPERLDVEPDTQQRVEMLTEHIKLESDFKEELASEGEELTSVKQEPDSVIVGSYSDHEKENPSEECSVKSEVSSDAASDKDWGTVPQSSADKPSASAASLVARAKEQLARACSVRLERLRSDEAPRASQACPATSQHTTWEHAYTCDTCATRFADKSVLITHLQDHSIKRLHTNLSSKLSRIQTDTTSYCCDMCSEQFTSKSILIRHIRAHKDTKRLTFKKHSSFNNQDKPYLCQQCNKSFKRRYNLRRHERIHSGVKPYECNECKKRFTQKISLNIHERTHSGVKPYECKGRNKRFAHKNNLDVHERTHSLVKPYECKECKKRFGHKCHLDVHERTHSGVKPYQCKECKKRFDHKYHLDVHERTHSVVKPYECKECKKRFARTSQLDVHERTHGVVRPCEYKDCKKRFSQKKCLIVHERTHSGVKPYECKECKKRFLQKSSLDVHERTHRKIKPYECKECKKRFSQKSSLHVPSGSKMHERTHSGVKPYECFNVTSRRKNDNTPACSYQNRSFLSPDITDMSLDNITIHDESSRSPNVDSTIPHQHSLNQQCITLDQISKLLDYKLQNNNTTIINDLKTLIQAEIGPAISEIKREFTQKHTSLTSKQEVLFQQLNETTNEIAKLQKENERINTELQALKSCLGTQDATRTQAQP